MSSKPKASVDPELKRQLAAANVEQAVEAAFSLRAPDDKPLIAADEVHSTVNRILNTAQEKTGKRIHDVYVLPRTQQFILAAPPEILREILKCPEIASALANKQSKSMAIAPVPSPAKKSPVRKPKPKRKDE